MATRDQNEGRYGPGNYEDNQRRYGAQGDDYRSERQTGYGRSGQDDEDFQYRTRGQGGRGGYFGSPTRSYESSRQGGGWDHGTRDSHRGNTSGYYGNDPRAEGGFEGGSYRSQVGSIGSQTSRAGYLGSDGQDGLHRGKGPRDYKRSDDRIREDINDRLTDDSHLDASQITVAVNDGEVTLSGSVSDRQAKRRAEDIADNVSGVIHVQNNLRVSASQSSSYRSQSDSDRTSRYDTDQNSQSGWNQGSGTGSNFN